MATRLVFKKPKSSSNITYDKKSNKLHWKKRLLYATVFVSVTLVASILQGVYISENPKMKDTFWTSAIEPLPTMHPDTVEASKLREENKKLKELVSRGESQRELDNIQKRKVIDSLNSRLRGGLLEGKGEIYYEAGKLYNIESQLLVAISVNETTAETRKGNNKWTPGMSQVLRECNNVGGLNWYDGANMFKDDKFIPLKGKGRYIIYPSINDSIYDLSRRLRMFYFDKGLNTIPLVGSRYAPLDDYQNGMFGMHNESWVSTVTEVYNELKEASN